MPGRASDSGRGTRGVCHDRGRGRSQMRWRTIVLMVAGVIGGLSWAATSLAFQTMALPLKRMCQDHRAYFIFIINRSRNQEEII